MLEDIQLLQQDEASRVGRRLEKGEAAIFDRDRLLNFSRKGCEIGGRYQRSGCPTPLREPPRQRAAVEGFGTLRGDFLEGAGEVGLQDRRADRRGLALDQ